MKTTRRDLFSKLAGIVAGGVATAALLPAAVKELVETPVVPESAPVAAPLLETQVAITEEIRLVPGPSIRVWPQPDPQLYFVMLPGWTGDPLDSDKSVQDWLGEKPMRDLPVTDEELRFYYGYQWPLDVSMERAQAGRPTITENHLPQIVSRALQFSLNRGELFRHVDYDDMIALMVRRNRHAQVFFNYCRSTEIEMRSQMPPISINRMMEFVEQFNALEVK